MIKTEKNLLILLGIFLIMNLYAQDRDKNYIPKNLEEAISQLDILFADSTKSQIINMTEEEFIVKSHFSTGMWIRNNWGLWSGKELAKYFNDLRIYHPDDMSGIILRSYYRHLRNKDFKVEEQIEHYQEHWNKFIDYNRLVRNDAAFARQEKVKFESSIRERNEKLKMEFPIGSLVEAWVDISDFKRSQITGEIVDWRVAVSKGGRLGSSKGPEVNIEYLEAKVKVAEYMDIKKKKRIERRNRMTNNELWVNLNLIRKIE